MIIVEHMLTDDPMPLVIVENIPSKLTLKT
jgi:hypothetical protein